MHRARRALQKLGIDKDRVSRVGESSYHTSNPETDSISTAEAGTQTDHMTPPNTISTLTTIIDMSTVADTSSTGKLSTTHMSAEQMITNYLDKSARGMLAILAQIPRAGDFDERYEILDSLEPLEQIRRIRSITAFLLVFKPLETLEYRQDLVLGCRLAGHEEEERQMIKEICPDTPAEPTADVIARLLIGLAHLEKKFHPEETQWQLDEGILNALAQTYYS